MAEALEAWLAALPDGAIARLSRKVLGGPGPARALTERALAQRLNDPEWISKTLAHLGPRASRVAATLVRAGVPVVRGDLNALANGPDFDPVEALEEHGLVAPVRTGRGMPTHVSLTPGLEALVAGALGETLHPGHVERGAAHAGDRRRFELALVVTALAQHPPRLTKDGRLHATDLAHLAEKLAPLHLTAPAIERLLSKLTDLGTFGPSDGRLQVVPALATEVETLHLRLALTELSAPSAPEGALVLVAQLVGGGTLPVKEVLEAAQVAILRERANGDDQLRRGARRELAETLTSLFGLASIVLLDAHGAPAGNTVEAVLARLAEGDSLELAVEPDVAAALRGEARPERKYAPGHVQSSFEVVADAGCDPSIVARVGLFSELVRADRAAVLRLTRESVSRGKSLGASLETLSEALSALSARPTPANVTHVLADWFERAPAAFPPVPLAVPPPIEESCAAAREALAGAHSVAPAADGS